MQQSQVGRWCHTIACLEFQHIQSEFSCSGFNSYHVIFISWWGFANFSQISVIICAIFLFAYFQASMDEKFRKWSEKWKFEHLELRRIVWREISNSRNQKDINKIRVDLENVNKQTKSPTLTVNVINTTPPRGHRVSLPPGQCMLGYALQAPLPRERTGRSGWGKWGSVVSLWPTRTTQRSSHSRSGCGARGSRLRAASVRLNKRPPSTTPTKHTLTRPDALGSLARVLVRTAKLFGPICWQKQIPAVKCEEMLRPNTARNVITILRSPRWAGSRYRCAHSRLRRSGQINSSSPTLYFWSLTRFVELNKWS